MALASPLIAVPLDLDPRSIADLDPTARIADLSGGTMGTYWRVRLAAPPGVDLAAVQAAIESRLANIASEMSHWAPDSMLSRFNDAPGGTWVALPTDFAIVIAAGLTLAERTDGAFDPAIGRVTDIHGLGPNAVDMPPGPSEIEAAVRVSGWQRLAFDGQARRLRQSGGLWLDLSGIAKGHAVDVVAALLNDMGLRHALVEIGGECAGRGIRPDGDPWWVDLETPPGVTLAPLRIALHQLAVATSGNYIRGDHNLDPRTGLPVRNGIISVSVLHASAMQADAWATALTVLGLEDGMDVARREDLAVRMIHADGSDITEWLSPALERML